MLVLTLVELPGTLQRHVTEDDLPFALGVSETMNRKRISALLIEHNSGEASFIRKLLAENDGLSCTLEWVDSLDCGVHRIAQSGVELVLLGLSDGAALDTLRELCAVIPEAVPVIVISAVDDQEVAVQALQAGAQDYLVSGQFDSAQLVRAIRHSLARQSVPRQRAKLDGELLQRTLAMGSAVQQLEMENAEHLRIEQSLRHSEQEFRAILDHTFQMMGLLAPDGTIIEANRTALRFCALDESDVLGKRFWETPWWAHSQQEQEKLRAAIEQAAKGELVRYETTHCTADGGLRDVDFSLKPVFDDAGHVVLIVPEGRDITKRKRTEEALWQSSQMLRLVLDHMPAFVFWKDRNSVYLGCNSRFAANAGLSSPEEIVGLTDLDLSWKNAEAESYRADDRRVIETGVPKLNYEETQLTADDRTIWVRTSKIPLRDSEGNVVGVLGAFEDITERKRAEESLALRSFALDYVHEAAFLVDDQGRFHYVNEESCRTLGYTRDELLRMTVADIDPDWPAEAWADRWLILKAKRSLNFEGRHRAKDGRIFPVEITANYLEYGGKSYDIALARDITERKRAEEEQEKLRQRLHQAQKMEAIGQLAGGIAHDFNNILGIINGYSELVLRDPEIQEQTQFRIKEILTAGQRAASLTRQLLAFSRKLVLQPRVLSLNDVVEGMDKMLRRLLGDEIDITTKLDPCLDLVKADPGQMEQVLLNLCINARDAMPNGGSLIIETANVETGEMPVAEHFSMAPGRYVKITVTDTGAGMDKETLSRVFEPFFTTKGPEHGTGLGLATVYGIVRQSGGYVWADSNSGKGATFSIYLPHTTEAVESCVKQATPQQATTGSETVLLVEDAARLRALFRKIIEDAGYTVLEAEDGATAIQIADEFQGEISLLLTDVSLPKIKGTALAEIFLQRRTGIKVLLVSGYSPDGVLQPGMPFLQKPFSSEDLLRKMREVLDSPQSLAYPASVD